MNHTVVVHVLQGLGYLVEVALGLDLGQTLPSLNELIEGLVGTQLQQNIHVLMILEDVLKVDNVLVLQPSVNLNL